MTASSPDDFAAALRDKPVRPPHGLGGDGGNGGARILGLIFLSLGLIMLATQVWLPIEEAQRVSASFHFDSHYTPAIPAAVVCGAMLLVFGVRAFRCLMAGSASLRLTILGLVLAALGFGLDYGVKAHLESLGYRLESQRTVFGVPVDPAP